MIWCTFLPFKLLLASRPLDRICLNDIKCLACVATEAKEQKYAPRFAYGHMSACMCVCVCFAWFRDHTWLIQCEWTCSAYTCALSACVSWAVAVRESESIADSASIKRYAKIKEVKRNMTWNFSAQVQLGRQTTVLSMNKFKNRKTKNDPSIATSSMPATSWTPDDVADPAVMAGHVWMAWTWLCLSGSFGIWSILHVANKFRLGSFCQGMFLWHLGRVCYFIFGEPFFLLMFRN